MSRIDEQLTLSTLGRIATALEKLALCVLVPNGSGGVFVIVPAPVIQNPEPDVDVPEEASE
jgi:hypothetical protein